MRLYTTSEQIEELYKIGKIEPSPCISCGSVQCAVCSSDIQKDTKTFIPTNDVIYVLENLLFSKFCNEPESFKTIKNILDKIKK